MKVVIVDDEPDIRETTGLLLQLDGHEVEFAADWRHVLDMDLGDVDVVLQDLRMPGLKIREYVAALRRRADTRIVLFTADRILDADAAAMDVDGILSKPFDVEDLRLALQAREATTSVSTG